MMTSDQAAIERKRCGNMTIMSLRSLIPLDATDELRFNFPGEFSRRVIYITLLTLIDF